MHIYEAHFQFSQNIKYVGMFLNLNKMKIRRISNHLKSHILFTIEHREYSKCSNGEIIHLYPLNELISNLMPATGLKKVGTGWTKG